MKKILKDKDESKRNLGENIVWGSWTIRNILIYLNKKGIDYASNVARNIESCYSDIIKKFKELKKEGLIEPVENKGKKIYPFVYMSKKNKYFKLTNKGKKIVELLLEIDEELK